MDAVEVLDEPISENALQLRDSISSYTEQAFKMYGGQMRITSPESMIAEYKQHVAKLAI